MNMSRDSMPCDSAITNGIDLARHATSNWPLLSERELNRLRFLAYCRAHELIRSPAPVRASVDTLCDEIVAALPAERATDQAPPVSEPLPYLHLREGSTFADTDTRVWRAALASVPPTFAARRDCHPNA